MLEQSPHLNHKGSDDYQTQLTFFLLQNIHHIKISIAKITIKLKKCKCTMDELADKK